jgi:hypothetical protein
MRERALFRQFSATRHSPYGSTVESAHAADETMAQIITAERLVEHLERSG